MSKVVEKRDALRVSRTCVREAHTNFRRALDMWQQGSQKGRTALEAASNAVLKSLFLPHLHLGPLSKLPGLEEAARAKLRTQVQKYVGEVTASIDCMEEARTGMECATRSVSDMAGKYSDMKGLAIFMCSSGESIAQLLATISNMYAAQLEVCKRIVAAFTAMQLIQSEEGSKTSAVKQAKETEEVMQAMIATWMLQTKIDQPQVDTIVDLLRDEMRGV